MILGHVTRGYCDAHRENQRRERQRDERDESLDGRNEDEGADDRDGEDDRVDILWKAAWSKTRPRRGSLEAVRAPYSWGRSCL